MNKNEFGLTNFFNNNSLKELLSILKEDNTEVFLVNGSNVDSETSFFEQLVRDLPINEASIELGNWDQILDRLWQHIHLSGNDRFALIWTHTDKMLHENLDILISFVTIMNRFSISLYNPQTANTKPKSFNLFLLGTGPNFK